LRIPNATHGEATLHGVVEPEHAAAAEVAHGPDPCTALTVISSTPPETATAKAVERTIAVVTVITRKGRKASRVVEGKIAADRSGFAINSPVSGCSKSFAYA